MTPAQLVAIEKGRRFHAAVEEWIKTGTVPVFDDADVSSWFRSLTDQWTPPPWIKTEVAWGLRPDGSYVDVEEPEPHVYVAVDGSELLTAGRADLAWWEGGLYDGVICTPDLKAGKWAVEPAITNLQANAAGYALALRYKAFAYQPGIYYAQSGAFDWGDVVEMGSDQAAEAFYEIRLAAQLPAAPIPGPWCGDCWEFKKSTCKEGMAWKP